jgi:protein involved in polysaccharide export with SLBB domain
LIKKRRMASIQSACLAAGLCLLPAVSIGQVSQDPTTGNGQAGTSMSSPTQARPLGASPFQVPAGSPGTPQLRGDTSRSAPANPGQQTGDRAPPTQAADAAQGQTQPPNEFQKFVAESVGENLPLFGSRLFESQASQTFTPAQDVPVPPDYPLGQGDELIVRGWGAIDIDVRGTIDRNGALTIPKVGPVQLAGVRAGQAEGLIRAAIGRVYKDFELSVTFGQLRTITVYVVGQAKRPGTYNLSSLSTLVTALFASGGPNFNGSLRRVQLRRASQTVTEIDLYTFIATGDKSKDMRLLDGDVIVVPPATGYVALAGKVITPAIYELKGEAESIESLLALAGGLPVIADPRRAFLERLTPDQAQPRTVEEFALDASGLRRTLRRGDILNVLPVMPEFANAVTLRGAVSQQVRMPWRDGMRVRDLIPSAEALMTRESVRRQNRSLLDGESSGQKPLAERVGQLLDEINLDYAVVERLNRQDLSVTLIPFELGKALADRSDPSNLLLRPGDVVSVFSVDDVRVPQAKRRVMVRVEGEVARPGVYQMTTGDTLQGLVDRAGGLTRDAYLYGSSFFREDARKRQIENLQRLVRTLEQELSGSVQQAAQTTGAVTDQASLAVAQARLQAAQQVQRMAIERLRTLQPTGRIALDLPTELTSAVSQLPSLRLQPGDRFVVSSRPDFVHVVGSVNTESALLWKSGKTASQYLEQAGVSAGGDRDNLILLRADGSAQTNGNSWGNRVAGLILMPGDTLIFPEKIDRETTWSVFLRNARDLTQVFYNLGLGAAAIQVLRNR